MRRSACSSWRLATLIGAVGLAAAACKDRTDGEASNLAMGRVAETMPADTMPAVRVRNVKCREYKNDNGQNGQHDPQNLYEHRRANQLILKVYRSQKRWKASEIELGLGEWIGAVQNYENGPSTEFPMLREDEFGCVFFIANRDTTTGFIEADAYFHLDKQADEFPRKFGIAMYCVVTVEHIESTPPNWGAVSDKCKKLYVKAEFEGRVVSFAVDPDDPTAAVDSTAFVNNALKQQLLQQGLTEAGVKDLLGTIMAGGPWFPCAQTGCCRAS